MGLHKNRKKHIAIKVEGGMVSNVYLPDDEFDYDVIVCDYDNINNGDVDQIKLSTKKIQDGERIIKLLNLKECPYV